MKHCQLKKSLDPITIVLLLGSKYKCYAMLSNLEGTATRQHRRMNSNTVHVKSLTNLMAKDKEHGCFSPFATFCIETGFHSLHLPIKILTL